MANGSTFPWTFPFTFGVSSGGFDIELPTTLRSPGVNTVVSDRQIVSVHTVQGVQLFQFLPDDLIGLKWTREKHEVSICELVVPSSVGYNRLPELTPWLHWVSVWDESGEELYWTGPIQRIVADRDTMNIAARDASALMARTRCPLTKRWEAADPAEVAEEMWVSMIELHGLHTRAIVRRDPMGDRFDYQTEADTKMVDDVMSELVAVGLCWSVVSGTPLLGPAPTAPIAALGERDFVGGGLALIRDGSESYNDVLLRASDNLARAKVRMGGLNLQTTVTMDSMFGVSNAQRAVTQLARYSGSIHDAVSVPDGAALHPRAPVTIGQLIPSIRLVIDAYGMLTTMELARVTVECTQANTVIGLTLESVNDDLPELLDTSGVTVL